MDKYIDEQEEKLYKNINDTVISILLKLDCIEKMLKERAE